MLGGCLLCTPLNTQTYCKGTNAPIVNILTTSQPPHFTPSFSTLISTLSDPATASHGCPLQLPEWRPQLSYSPPPLRGPLLARPRPLHTVLHPRDSNHQVQYLVKRGKRPERE